LLEVVAYRACEFFAVVSVAPLLVNAFEAIGRKEGEIIVSTHREHLDAKAIDKLHFNPEMAAGPYVAFVVEDNGCGMSPDVLNRMFEPFFSTKFTGRGLGLAAVLGIVRGHRGGMLVESSPNQGTRFKLLLPAVTNPVASRTWHKKPDRRSAKDLFTGTALVIDDDDMVRAVTAKMLRRLGLEVLQAENGAVGLKRYKTHRDKIRLILLDLTMPVLDGEQTLRELRALGETPPVVIMSGFSERDTLRRFDETAVTGFLAKPISYTDLTAALGGALTR